jgi:hypothetical protein
MHCFCHTKYYSVVCVTLQIECKLMFALDLQDAITNYDVQYCSDSHLCLNILLVAFASCFPDKFNVFTEPIPTTAVQ